MSPFSPLSYQTINSVIYGCEGFFAHNMLVIACPSTNDGIQLHDEFSGTESFICLHRVPYLFEEGMYILFRWFDEQFVLFSRLVLSDILT